MLSLMDTRVALPTTPYRSTQPRRAPSVIGRELFPIDLLAVVLGALAILLLPHWSAAIDVIATQVLGFPSLRG